MSRDSGPWWVERPQLWLGGVLWVAFGAAVSILAASSIRLVQGLDEASHVLASANPWASPGYGIYFGYFLHPLWRIGQEHLFGFRLAGFAALALTVMVFFAFFRRLFLRLGGERPRPFWGAAICASFLIMAFSRYVVGMRTPNYDWVVLVGAMFFAAGWFAMETRRTSGFPWLAEGLCAFGLFTVGLGKWTVLPGYLLVLGVLVLWKNRSWEDRSRTVAGLIFWITLFGVGLVLYATLEGLAAAWKAGWIQISIHSHDRAWSRLPVDLLKFCWTLLRASPFVAALYGAVWAALYFSRQRKKPEPLQVAGLTFLFGLPLVGLRGHFIGGGEYFAKGVMVTAVWLLGVLFMARPKLADFRGEAQGTYARAVLLLLALPWLNGVGTATSMVDYQGYGLIFPVAAAWLILGRAQQGGLPSWCVAAAILTIGVTHAARVATSTLNVHRLGSAWVEAPWIETGPEQGKFRHYPAAVNGLKEISGVMERNGYRPGEPILGLTDLPGLVYFLGGVSPGVCWYQSYRFPESYEGVRKNLENIPPEILRKCWAVFREKNKTSEALELVWPRDTGVPLPVRLEPDSVFLWPWEPEQRKMQPVRLYRPALPGGT